MADKLYKNPSKIKKMGDRVAWETNRQVARGTVKKVKPDGTRIVKNAVGKYVAKKKTDLK